MPKVEREGETLWLLPTPHPNLSSGLPLAESSRMQGSLGNVVFRGPTPETEQSWRRMGNGPKGTFTNVNHITQAMLDHDSDHLRVQRVLFMVLKQLNKGTTL